MKTVRTGALLTPICDAQQWEPQDEEIRNNSWCLWWWWNSVPVDKIRRWTLAINTTAKLYVSTSFESVCVRVVSSTCKTLRLHILGHMERKAVCWLNVSSQPFMETTRARQNSSNKYFYIRHYYSPTLIWHTRDSEYFYSSFVPPSSTYLLHICSMDAHRRKNNRLMILTSIPQDCHYTWIRSYGFIQPAVKNQFNCVCTSSCLNHIAIYWL
jgi:hypothetical protein